MCTEISAFQGERSEFADFAAAIDEDGGCQFESVGHDHGSPGPVASFELLARRVFSPTHFNSFKCPPVQLDDALFADAFTIGCSVSRLLPDWPVRSAALHELGEQAAKARREGADGRDPQPDRKYLGLVHISAAEARSVVLESKPVIGRVRVYDTAKPIDILHADIIFDRRDIASDSSKDDKQARKLLRVKLLTVAMRRGFYVSPYLAEDDRDQILQLGTTLQD
jgi:hypothetical protein